MDVRVQLALMRSRVSCAVALIAFAGAACISPLGGYEPPGARGSQRVLFIGNSHTRLHDVPSLVEGIARLAGDRELQVARVALDGYSLQDHAADGRALAALQRQGWEYVVLQQGPSSLPENRAHLRTWAEHFEAPIRAAGATPVLYQTWPEVSRRALDAENVLLSYREAAGAVGGILAPAGDAMTAAIAESPRPDLFGGDGYHASLHGAYLAALVIYCRISERDPRSLPDIIPYVPTSPSVVRALQRAAHVALTRNPARPPEPL